jgi:flagellar hook-basal body complex protein FliE
MTVPAIPPVAATPFVAPVAAPAPPAPAGAAEFGNALTQGIDALQRTQANADGLATQAATGSLSDVASYMIASNEAALATELTTAVRDKAVAAFTSIMNMQM